MPVTFNSHVRKALPCVLRHVCPSYTLKIVVGQIEENQATLTECFLERVGCYHKILIMDLITSLLQLSAEFQPAF